MLSRWHRRYILVVANACALGYAQLLSRVGDAGDNAAATMVAAGMVKGICSAALATCQGVVWAKYFGRTHLGAIASLDKMAMVSGSAMGPLVFGLARQFSDGWNGPLRSSALLPLILLVVDVLFLRAPVVKPRPRSVYAPPK